MNAGALSMLWREAPVSFRLGVVLLAANIILAALGPWISPYAQDMMMAGPPLQGASLAHPFGTDQLGRDIWSRALAGGWIVMTLSVCGTVLGMAVGAAIGLTSGIIGGWVDEVLMRLTEAIVAVPFLIFALLIISIAGPSVQGSPLLLIFVVAAVYFPRIARMARAAASDVVTRDFVLAARLRGEGAWSIARREVFPNTTGVLLVEFAIRAGYAPVLIGTLGFLGFGLKPPSPEWGLMMSEYRNLLVAQPMAVFGPGLLLASLVIGLGFFTEGLSHILGKRSSFR